MPAHYEMNDSTLVITHSAGIFSCYTIRLEALLDYFRTYKRLPCVVDSSQQFMFYKEDPKKDISPYFFETIGALQIAYSGKLIHLTSEPNEQQFSDYSKLHYADVKPFVEKYFAPSIFIRERIRHLEKELPHRCQPICGIRYRGTSKSLETNQPSYAELIFKAVQLQQKVPQLTFLVQSDEQGFLEYATRELGDDCCFSISESLSTKGRFADYVAEIIILSRCKYLITTSGNGELWIRLFRGNNKGSLQWLSPKKCMYGTQNKDFDPNKKCFWIDNDRLIS